MGSVRPRRSRGVSALCAAAPAAGWVGCSSPAEEASQPPAQVGRFASDNPGSVNTFWLQTPRGLVVTDSGRNVAGGRRAVEEIRRTGQSVVAILITHPHPDHVGGLGPLHEAYPQAPIYASESTVNLMRTDPLMFNPLARRADADYPAQLTYPDQTFGPDASLELGGIRLETAEFGPAESQTTTAYYEPRIGALFSGDLTRNQATPFLLSGRRSRRS